MNIAYLIVLTLCLAVALRQRDLMTASLIWILVLVCVTWVVETIGYGLLRAERPNFWLYQLFTPIEYGLLAGFFHSVLLSKALRLAILISIGVVGVSAGLYAYRVGVHLPNSYTYMLGAALLMFWASCFFYELYHRQETYQLNHLPEFWIAAGVLVFYAGSFLQMGLFTYLVRSGNKELANRLYFINHALNICLYSLYAVGFLCRKKSSLSS
jgi:hypothetical protein